MPALKYWDGAAWQTFLGQGGAPAAPAPPAMMGQPGSVVARGAANLTDVNGVNGGLYDVTTFLVGWTFPYTTQVHVTVGLYGGYGGSDVVQNADIYALGPNAVASSSPSPIHCHAAYWVPIPMVASWQCSPGMDNGFKVRYNFQSGSNFHTSGTINYQVIAI